MRYEIDYFSRSGNSKRLADAVEKLFPLQNTKFINLHYDEPTEASDAYIIVFSMNRGTVPLRVMDTLDVLAGKTILCLVTLGAEEPSDYQDKLEQKLKPFLPERCDYRGSYLCRGEFPESVVAAAVKQLETEPDNEYANMVSECCTQAKGHPDRTDVENVCAFVCDKLNLYRQ